MIDIHCHLEYMKKLEAVIQLARQKMTGLITSVAHPKDFDKILSLHNSHPNFVHITAGLHPEEAMKLTDSEISEYISKIKANKDKISGIGEVGLDYHRESDKIRQKEIFLKFINLANELSLPLVIHVRDAFPDTLKLLENSEVLVIFHCFSDPNYLEESLNKNYWISINTIVCKSKTYRKIAKRTPIKRMLLETDAPWMDPKSSELINRPWKIEQSANLISEKLQKQYTKDEILKQTENNARKVFKI